MLLTLYTKTVQLYYPFEMLLNNKLNTISSLPGTYVKSVLLKDVLLFKCLSIDLIGTITPDQNDFFTHVVCFLFILWFPSQFMAIFHGFYGNQFVLSYPFNKSIKWSLIGSRNTKERRKHTT